MLKLTSEEIYAFFWYKVSEFPVTFACGRKAGSQTCQCRNLNLWPVDRILFGCSASQGNASAAYRKTSCREEVVAEPVEKDGHSFLDGARERHGDDSALRSPADGPRHVKRC